MSPPTSTTTSGSLVRALAVQRPEVGAVAEAPQRQVLAPGRLDDGFPRATGDHVLGTVGRPDDELGGVPRHVRVVPLQPRQRDAVRAPRRGSDTKSVLLTRTSVAAVLCDAHHLVHDVGRAPRSPRGLPDGEAARRG